MQTKHKAEYTDLPFYRVRGGRAETAGVVMGANEGAQSGAGRGDRGNDAGAATAGAGMVTNPLQLQTSSGDRGAVESTTV